MVHASVDLPAKYTSLLPDVLNRTSYRSKAAEIILFLLALSAGIKRSYALDGLQFSLADAAHDAERGTGHKAEWDRSDFDAPNVPVQHRSCIDCHMHADVARIGENIRELSSDRGRLKNNLVTHQFTGANCHRVGLRNPDLERMSIALLRPAAKLETPLTRPGNWTCGS